MWIYFPVLFFLFSLLLVGRRVLPRHDPKTPVPLWPAHKASPERINELEYELGIGPGGDRRRAEELEAATRAAERERRAVREEELAQTNPAQYWRDVASDIWRRNGNY